MESMGDFSTEILGDLYTKWISLPRILISRAPGRDSQLANSVYLSSAPWTGYQGPSVYMCPCTSSQDCTHDCTHEYYLRPIHIDSSYLTKLNVKHYFSKLSLLVLVKLSYQETENNKNILQMKNILPFQMYQYK